MNGLLEYVVVKLCENLPLDLTLFERDGKCNKPNTICQYCRKNGDDSYLCYKKTYTLNPHLRTT